MAMSPPYRGPWWPSISLALKAALAGLLLFALLHPDWDRFAAKAMGIRAMTRRQPAAPAAGDSPVEVAPPALEP
jgi:hypothetical protein